MEPPPKMCRGKISDGYGGGDGTTDAASGHDDDIKRGAILLCLTKNLQRTWKG